MLIVHAYVIFTHCLYVNGHVIYSSFYSRLSIWPSSTVYILWMELKMLTSNSTSFGWATCRWSAAWSAITTSGYVLSSLWLCRIPVVISYVYDHWYIPDPSSLSKLNEENRREILLFTSARAAWRGCLTSFADGVPSNELRHQFILRSLSSDHMHQISEALMTY